MFSVACGGDLRSWHENAWKNERIWPPNWNYLNYTMLPRSANGFYIQLNIVLCLL